MIYSLKNKSAIYGKYIKQIKYTSPLDKSMVINGYNIDLLKTYQYYSQNSMYGYLYKKINDGKCYYSLVKSYYYMIYDNHYMDNYFYYFLIPLLVSENKNSVIVKKSSFEIWDGYNSSYDYYNSGYYTFTYKNKTWYCTSFDNRNDCGTLQEEYNRQMGDIQYYIIGSYIGYRSPWGNGDNSSIRLQSINNSIVYGNTFDINTQNFSNKLIMIENAKLLIDKYNFKQKYEDQVIPQNWKIN